LDDGAPVTSASQSEEPEVEADPFHLYNPGCNDLDAIEYADSLEKGLSREIVTEFTLPMESTSKLRRHTVLKSDDGLEYRLLSDQYAFLLYARVCVEARRVDIFGYDPKDDVSGRPFDPSRPAFTLSYNASRTDWRLTKERCEHCGLSPKHLSCRCSGKQQVAYVRHSTKKLGEAVSNIMEVNIPGFMDDGSPVVWCPRRGAPDLAGSDGGGHEVKKLVTKLPEWNEEVQCLVLEFAGRTVTKSPQNFQLARSDDLSEVVCQHGKIGPNTYSLDFKRPLSVIQAFGMALSTTFLA